jgi:hypothetical protein
MTKGRIVWERGQPRWSWKARRLYAASSSWPVARGGPLFANADRRILELPWPISGSPGCQWASFVVRT